MVNNIIDINKVSSIKDIGKVMDIAMKEFSGLADGTIVQKIVREALNK